MGVLEGGKLGLREIHRFPNDPVEQESGLHWDCEALFKEMKTGLRKYASAYGPELDGISVDSWGVDYVLLGKDGAALSPPYHYRDKRTEGVPEQVFAAVGRDKVLEQTGNQVLVFNTLYQIYSARDSAELKAADKMLLIADYFNYLFCGKAATEYSLATTSQMYDPREGRWAEELLKELGLPTRMLPEVVQPGTVLGKIRPELAEECGIAKSTRVIASASHDTACAVAATPLQPGWAYVSSGTWSLIGRELSKPLISDDVREANFTNEGGVSGTIRFLKNATGLWPLQCCQKKWGISFEEINRLAEQADPFATLVDFDDARFVNPDDMEEEIAAYCRDTEQEAPADKGAVARCVLESLALKYRLVVEELEGLTGEKVPGLNVVGGGVKNELLCKMAASATGRPVKAGPVEATSIGNILVQAKAKGEIGSLAELRQVVSNSFAPVAYAAEAHGRWDEEYSRFREICGMITER